MITGFLTDLRKSYPCPPMWDEDEATQCPGTLTYGVQRSFAGYYIGWWCCNCGPYSRDSGYFSDRKEAEYVLARRLRWMPSEVG